MAIGIPASTPTTTPAAAPSTNSSVLTHTWWNSSPVAARATPSFTTW